MRVHERERTIHHHYLIISQASATYPRGTDLWVSLGQRTGAQKHTHASAHTCTRARKRMHTPRMQDTTPD